MKLDFSFRDLSEALTSTDTCTKKHFTKKYQGREIPLGRRQTSWLLIYKCDQGVELENYQEQTLLAVCVGPEFGASRLQF